MFAGDTMKRAADVVKLKFPYHKFLMSCFAESMSRQTTQRGSHHDNFNFPFSSFLHTNIARNRIHHCFDFNISALSPQMNESRSNFIIKLKQFDLDKRHFSGGSHFFTFNFNVTLGCGVMTRRGIFCSTFIHCANVVSERDGNIRRRQSRSQ